jgi:hypothetical protein
MPALATKADLEQVQQEHDDKLVGAGLLGGGAMLAGLGGVGGYAAHRGHAALQRVAPSEGVGSALRDFETSAKATTPAAERVMSYTRGGSRLMNERIHGLGTGYGLMRKIYSNPLAANVVGRGGWDEDRQGHYRAFRQGQLPAVLKLDEEAQGSRTLTHAFQGAQYDALHQAAAEHGIGAGSVLSHQPAAERFRALVGEHFAKKTGLPGDVAVAQHDQLLAANAPGYQAAVDRMAGGAGEGNPHDALVAGIHDRPMAAALQKLQADPHEALRVTGSATDAAHLAGGEYHRLSPAGQANVSRHLISHPEVPVLAKETLGNNVLSQGSLYGTITGPLKSYTTAHRRAATVANAGRWGGLGAGLAGAGLAGYGLHRMMSAGDKEKDRAV